MNIYIIEGCQKTGKTTYIKKLFEERVLGGDKQFRMQNLKSFEYYHLPYFETNKEVLSYFKKLIRKIKKSKADIVILDRFTTTAKFYANTKKDWSPKVIKKFNKLEKSFFKTFEYNSTYYSLYASPTTIQERYLKDGVNEIWDYKENKAIKLPNENICALLGGAVDFYAREYSNLCIMHKMMISEDK